MLRRTRLHCSLHRPNLVLGGDRELVMCSGLLSFALAYTLEPLAILFAIGLWCGSLALLRKMAAADPRMRSVYLAHRRYRAYYPARSTPFCTR
jgi:type IV secretory pathway TrbD component